MAQKTSLDIFNVTDLAARYVATYHYVLLVARARDIVVSQWNTQIGCRLHLRNFIKENKSFFFIWHYRRTTNNQEEEIRVVISLDIDKFVQIGNRKLFQLHILYPYLSF